MAPFDERSDGPDIARPFDPAAAFVWPPPDRDLGDLGDDALEEPEPPNPPDEMLPPPDDPPLDEPPLDEPPPDEPELEPPPALPMPPDDEVEPDGGEAFCGSASRAAAPVASVSQRAVVAPATITRVNFMLDSS